MRIGIVGAGWWATDTHAPAFKQAGATIVGVHSRTLLHAQKLATAHGAKAFERYEELLMEVDAVAISTSDDTHAHYANLASRAGIDVFVEKPLALSLEQARSIVETALEYNVTGLTAFTSRGDLAAGTAMRRVQDGSIGEVLYIRGTFHADFLADPVRPTPWRALAEFGGKGGAIADVGAHLFDLARFVSGLEFGQILAQASIPFKRNPPVTNYDEAAIIARMGSASGLFSLSRVHTGGSQGLELEVQGSKGALKVRPAMWGQGKDAQLWLSERPGNWRIAEPDSDLLNGRDPQWRWGYFQFVELAQRFIAAAQNKTQPSPSLADGLTTQKVIEAATQSAESGVWETV